MSQLKMKNNTKGSTMLNKVYLTFILFSFIVILGIEENINIYRENTTLNTYNTEWKNAILLLYDFS